MKKSIIITGNQGCGKSTKIKNLVSQVSLNQLVRIRPTELDSKLKK